MAGQTQEQQLDTLQKQNDKQKKTLWKPVLIISIVVGAIAIIVVWILSILGSIPVFWAAIISAVLVVVPIVISLIGPLVSHDKPVSVVVQVQYPLPTQPAPLPEQSQPSAKDNVTYRDIIGFPPPTDARAIQQRTQTVEDIYTKLSQTDITALVLTGIGGAGKSTLAALVYEYAKKQRQLVTGIFQGTPLWLTVNESVTMADLAGTLSETLGKPIPDVGNLPPERQAVALFNILDAVDKPCLIVLDQFENLLNWQTGYALSERPGVGEWLDAINSRQCRSRILLTSRPLPKGTRPYPAACMQEYHVESMTTSEGIELLLKQGITGTDNELSKAVTRCEGHPFALVLLASLLRNHNLSLSTMFKEPVHPMYAQLWSGDIARNLLDLIFTKQLNEAQRALLLAFSIYREAVPLEAAQALMPETPNVPKGNLQETLKVLEVLRAQHLLTPVGEGRYRPHAIVITYAEEHFDPHDEQANQNALRTAHAKAAQYYQQQVCPPRPERKHISDVYPLVEAIWHLCQAAQWQAAYYMLEHENIFTDLTLWGGNTILLEIYQLLKPSEEWHPKPAEESNIYNCLGRLYDIFGKKEKAHQCFEKALRIRRESRDRWGEAIILSELGSIYDDLGQKEEALRYYNEALGIKREVGDHGGEGKTLNKLGIVYDDLGQKEEALTYYEQALDISREVGDRGAEGTTLNNLGKFYNALGQKQEALTYFQQALNISREVGNRSVEGITLNNLGSVYAKLGQKQEALRYFKEALDITREMGGRYAEGTTLHNIGTLYFAKTDYSVALAYFLLARSIFEEIQSPNRDEVQKWIDYLREEIGKEQFAILLAQVEPQAAQIVEQSLHRGNGEDL